MATKMSIDRSQETILKIPAKISIITPTICSSWKSVSADMKKKDIGYLIIKVAPPSENIDWNYI